MDVNDYREVLAEATRHGWGFLAAYGLTWLICAWVWRRWSAKAGAYATLFQGMVALPFALLLTAITPGPERPTMGGMGDLAVWLATGQLLGLPVVIFFVIRGWFTQVPLVMVVLLVVHFAPYSWLYATPLYFVAGAAISVAAVLAHASSRRDAGTTDDHEKAGAGRVCLSTGVMMVISAAIAWAL